jgi:hypothetical protein
MQENYTKISKIKQLEAIGAWRATMGHLVGSADPTMHRPTWQHLCHLTNPWEWPRNTPPILLHRWFQVGSRWRAENEHHMDCWLTMLMSMLKWTKWLHTHTLLHPWGHHTEGGGMLKWTKWLHTHTLLHPWGHHTEGGGPTPQWAVTRRQGALPDAPLSLHRLSFRHM